MGSKKLFMQLASPCPCGGSGALQSYQDCCARWHQGLSEGVHANTPEALMRSRYSAYALGLLDYLLATWHPSTAPGDLELSPTQWLGLSVLHSEQSQDAGVVEFMARYKQGGKAYKLHEFSRFTREQGRWLYIDGQMPQNGDEGDF
jgi:SEC-C motif domain protein